ncbi:Type II secretion system protein F [Fervidicola ferrireducens]|uniref:Type II secretion system protein F n=1 Tax=Fervidicola ferrireducens TaxID=520764 RepID=A0A140LCA8_9FIRM|nr:type II secretion system F family protein [Fervidicola ferrireducens]KXG78183.1 Type II secretion system protein F [Fervidicola ferrireducens]
MAVYYYRGKNLKGEILHGVYETQSETDIVELLRKNGFYPVTIKKHPFYSFLYFLGEISLNKKYNELAFFCRQMSGMLEVGMPVMDCLAVLCQQSSHPGLARTFKKMMRDLNRGFTLSEAFKNQPGIFPDILVYAVETGEISGKLEDILKKLAVYFETIAKYRQRFKTSMIYPAFLGLISIAVYYFLSYTLMPLYSNMFAQAGIYLPVPTQIFIAITVNSKGLAISLTLIIISILLIQHRFRQNSKKAYKIDKFLLNMPVLGLLIKNNNAANFCRILGILLSSGIPLIKAIELAEKNMSNYVFKLDLRVARENIKKGETLASSLKTSSFPIFMLRMLQTGIESGRLDEILFKTADFYDNEVNALQQRVLALVEPLAILLMSIIIGFTVISAVLPMFRMYTTF